MKLYTKTGDSGKTGLFGGDRVRKDHQRIDAYGTIDELNSVVGLVRCHIKDAELTDLLQTVQNRLFDLGSDLATPLNSKHADKVKRISSDDVTFLELKIDHMQSKLPELRNFILPGGHPSAAYLHLARTVCRRAERLVVTLSETEQIGDLPVIYLNRLSDFFFCFARFANQINGFTDIEWTNK
ncbi:MAG: cob(I)yrinic acid a,c-diamide adenosyltransferase [Calditrichaeota bacterium]|nr:cob(I)yrinic acid a,c-diamide adenosyltransferase [Calditrichota bacterium]